MLVVIGRIEKGQDYCSLSYTEYTMEKGDERCQLS